MSCIVKRLAEETKDVIEQQIRSIGSTACYGKSSPLEEHVVQLMKYYIVSLLENQWDCFWEDGGKS